MDEFDLINYIKEQQRLHQINNNINIDIGDDAASITPPLNSELLITSDTLNIDVHFFKESLPQDISHKALAVNLSDLAAMGATPAWYTLNLTLPDLNKTWITNFCNGLFKLAAKHNIRLIGGDITKGPLSITITAIGHAPTNQAITRSNAKPGDLIYISNKIGEAGYILDQIYNKKYSKNNYNNLLTQLNSPTPQVQLGQELRNIASSCIDISDGLASDLSHILNKSHVSAKLYENKIPIPDLLKPVSHKKALEFILQGGDDYQLCFTVPKNKNHKIKLIEKKLNQELFNIGEIIDLSSSNNISELYLVNNKSKNILINNKGFMHFNN